MENNELKVQVNTYDLLSGELESTKVVNHNSKEDRQWMGKHCYWAFRNNKRIETYPVL